MASSLSRFMAPKPPPKNSTPLATVATVATVEPPDEPPRLWLIRHQDGRLVSHAFCPEATAREVKGLYPLALSIESEIEREPEDASRP